MNSPAVNAWRQQGNVSLWRYKDVSKSYSGIHLHGDTASVVSLMELFAALQMSGAGHRTIDLRTTTPAVASIPGPRRSFDSYSKIKLQYDESFLGIAVSINRDVLGVELGISGIEQLIHAFQQYKDGEDDFCIRVGIHGGTKNDIYLWFW